MKKTTYLLIILLTSIKLICQEKDAWVVFKDKENKDFYLSNPNTILSKKSYDRKLKYKIAIDETDIPITKRYLDTITNMGVDIIAKSKWFNRVHIRTNLNLIKKIKKISFVKKIILADKKLNKSINKNTNSINYKKSNLVNSNYFTQISMLNGHKLHDIGLRGRGINIAIMDAGFNGVDSSFLFKNVINEGRILYTYDFVNRKRGVYDDGYHGSGVFSILAGYKKNVFIGSAQEANYYLFKTEDSKTETPVEESYWVEAIELADSLGVDIVNSSLGYFYYDNENHSYDYKDLDGKRAFISMAANMAARKGILVVNSAGNSGYRKNGWIATPSDADSILAVGAVDKNGDYVDFSSFGPTSDNRIKPDVAALGLDVMMFDKNGLTFGNGTSLASPLITGLSACLWQAMREKNNIYLINLIKDNSKYKDIPNNLYGYGIPDFFAALQQHKIRYKNRKFSFVYDKIFINDYIYLLDSARVIIRDNLNNIVLSNNLKKTDKHFDIYNISNGIYSMEIKYNGKIINTIIVKQK